MDVDVSSRPASGIGGGGGLEKGEVINSDEDISAAEGMGFCRPGDEDCG